MFSENRLIYCAVLSCQKIISNGDVYYLLGTESVINCEECACNGKTEKYGVRGWNKVDKWVLDRIRKIMYDERRQSIITDCKPSEYKDYESNKSIEYLSVHSDILNKEEDTNSNMKIKIINQIAVVLMHKDKTKFLEDWLKKPIFDIEKHNINRLLNFIVNYNKEDIIEYSLIKRYCRCIGNFFEAKKLKQEGDKSGKDTIYLNYHLSEYYDIMDSNMMWEL